MRSMPPCRLFGTSAHSRWKLYQRRGFRLCLLSYFCLRRGHPILCICFSTCKFSLLLTYCQGFYVGPPSVLHGPSSSWVPALSDPLDILGDYQMTSSSQVLGTNLLILHFALSGLDTAGNPAGLVYSFLQSFIPNARLSYREVRFDLSSDKDVFCHHENMAELQRALEGCVIIYLVHP
jgi:hypothetical protein